MIGNAKTVTAYLDEITENFEIINKLLRNTVKLNKNPC